MKGLWKPWAGTFGAMAGRGQLMQVRSQPVNLRKSGWGSATKDVQVVLGFGAVIFDLKRL